MEDDSLLGTEELARKTKKKRWLSIYVVFFTMFMSAVSKLLVAMATVMT